MLGFPARVRACLSDLDGVLTRTAKGRAAARNRKEASDARLQGRGPAELLEDR
ncbi:hypothetical protein AB0D42_07580 [Streptomyces sp. NPDC048304]|uniref:hypothetical protein n=1 Tax=Streptomyces sp. NPDC048304 TaxID=3154820 RepID=UPI0033C9F1AB